MSLAHYPLTEVGCTGRMIPHSPLLFLVFFIIRVSFLFSFSCFFFTFPFHSYFVALSFFLSFVFSFFTSFSFFSFLFFSCLFHFARFGISFSSHHPFRGEWTEGAWSNNTTGRSGDELGGEDGREYGASAVRP